MIFQTRVINRLHHVIAFKSEEVTEFPCIELDIKKKGENIKILNWDRMNI